MTFVKKVRNTTMPPNHRMQASSKKRIRKLMRNSSKYERVIVILDALEDSHSDPIHARGCLTPRPDEETEEPEGENGDLGSC